MKKYLDSLIQLYINPNSFFKNNYEDNKPLITFLVIFLNGIIISVSKIERIKIVRIETESSWINYWVAIILMSTITSIVHWEIEGWWYKIRLKFSNVRNPTFEIASKLNIYSTLTYSLPVFIVLIGNSIVLDSPKELADESIIYIVSIVFLFYSKIVSYKAVVSKFDVNGIKPLFWFLILPLLIYFIFIILPLISALKTVFF